MTFKTGQVLWIIQIIIDFKKKILLKTKITLIGTIILTICLIIITLTIL